MNDSLSFRDLQAMLVDNGYPLPKFGADGHYGIETVTAVERWARSGVPLRFDIGHDASLPPASIPIVPADWMPDCDMDRLIVHWTAGASTASALDREHYHILVEASGNLVRGDKSIKDNLSAMDGVYAAHTLGCNTKSIGISLCGMAGAVESPFRPGPSPINREQWSVAAHVAADLVRKYGIPLDNTHVLSHGRVQANLGIAQRGKWDIIRFPWNLSVQGEECDEAFRAELRKYL